MNIKKTLSAVLSMTMLFTSASAVPVSNAYAAVVADSRSDEAETNGDQAKNGRYLTGTVTYSAPDKVIYKVGEELDVTGGICEGSTSVMAYNGLSSYIEDGGDIIDPDRPYTIDELDLSGFDNTKPGVYRIVPKVRCPEGVDENKIDYYGFSVMVVDGNTSEDNYVTAVGEKSFEFSYSYGLAVKTGDKLDSWGFKCMEKWHYEWHHDGEVEYLFGADNERYNTEGFIDTSTVDTNKPGVYKVTASKISQPNLDRDEITYSSGYIMVTENKPTDADEDEIWAINKNGGPITTTDVSDDPVTTTTVTTVSTGSTTSIIYTADQAFECLSVNTYPTQTEFMEGEEINTNGLNLRIRRYIPYEELGYDRSEMTIEPEFNSFKTFSPVNIDIVDKDNNVYNGTQFSQLPPGKYVAVILGDYRVWQDVQLIKNVDIAYEVEIKADDRGLLPEKTELSDKPLWPDMSKYYQTFKGVAAYPDKKVYAKGEELDLAGLIIKAQRRYGEKPSSREIDKYAENPVYLKTVLPETDIMKITDESGRIYNSNEFSMLPVGKYTVSNRKSSAEWGGYDSIVSDISLSYDIEIRNKNDIGEKVSEVKGDANLDEVLDISDSVFIMQSISNPSKYKMTEQGRKNADIDGNKDGVTNKDALEIQKMLLNLI